MAGWRKTGPPPSAIQPKWRDIWRDYLTTRSVARDTLSRELSRKPSWWRKGFRLATKCRKNCRDHGFCTSYLVEELAPTLRSNPSSTNRLKWRCAFRESNPICSAYSFRVTEVLVARNAQLLFSSSFKACNTLVFNAPNAAC